MNCFICLEELDTFHTSICGDSRHSFCLSCYNSSIITCPICKKKLELKRQVIPDKDDSIIKMLTDQIWTTECNLYHYMVKKIKNEWEDLSQCTITFGKHKGVSFSNLYRHDYPYLKRFFYTTIKFKGDIYEFRNKIKLRLYIKENGLV